ELLKASEKKKETGKEEEGKGKGKGQGSEEVHEFGIKPICAQMIFNSLEHRKLKAESSHLPFSWSLSVAMLEVYNEKVRDLLDSTIAKKIILSSLVSSPEPEPRLASVPSTPTSGDDDEEEEEQKEKEEE